MSGLPIDQACPDCSHYFRDHWASGGCALPRCNCTRTYPGSVGFAVKPKTVRETCPGCEHDWDTHSTDGCAESRVMPAREGEMRLERCGCTWTYHPLPPGEDEEEEPEMVNHPRHYNSNPSGVECLTVIRWMTLNAGTAVKYIWRAGFKVPQGKSARDAAIEDYRKAIFYLEDEIKRLGEM